jgi:hypothetical protein
MAAGTQLSTADFFLDPFQHVECRGLVVESRAVAPPVFKDNVFACIARRYEARLPGNAFDVAAQRRQELRRTVGLEQRT